MCIYDNDPKEKQSITLAFNHYYRVLSGAEREQCNVTLVLHITLIRPNTLTNCSPITLIKINLQFWRKIDVICFTV